MISSLTKVFEEDLIPAEAELKGMSALLGETVSFQIAYHNICENAFVSVTEPEGIRVRIRQVKSVPCNVPCNKDEMDDYYLKSQGGNFPDVLSELKNGQLEDAVGISKSIWIDLEVLSDCIPENYEIGIVINPVSDKTQILYEGKFALEVIGQKLPEQKIIHTEWFHADCLADYYKVEPLSEKHWDIMEHFICVYAKSGMNMILTPIFTPPLDTEVGGERTTVQLVDITEKNGVYTFGFSKLERFIKLCRSHGIHYFEMMHLFTQWGAKHAPKILAVKDGKYQQIFGWETDGAGIEYRKFLEIFLSTLVSQIKEWNMEKMVFFHISDEPCRENLQYYKNARNQVENQIQDFPIMDAISDYEFYKQGLTKLPIPGTNHVHEFIDHQVPKLWTYYCSSQRVEYSNRFFAMPLARVRILGVQLYKYNIKGFLHWGFNFYNTQYSKKQINPYEVTDAGGAFPGGDSFLVYPGEQGWPEESIRLMALRQAFYDIRALSLLEEKKGRELVLSLIDEGLSQPITFAKYPHHDGYLLDLRERVNALLKIS